jgi:hypothetical protein
MCSVVEQAKEHSDRHSKPLSGVFITAEQPSVQAQQFAVAYARVTAPCYNRMLLAVSVHAAATVCHFVVT